LREREATLLAQFRSAIVETEELQDGFSNDVGRVKGLEVYVFVVSDTRIALAPKRWFLHENDGLFYSDNLYPTAWLGPVVFILVVD